MKINREIKLYTFLTDNLNNLADVAIIQNNRKLGEKYALEALEYSKQFDDSNYLAYAYMNLGGIYKDSKRYDTALTMLNKALDIQVTNNYSDMMIATLLKVGQVYQVTGKQKLAIEKGYKAKTLALKLNHLPGKARVYQHLSNFYKTSNLDSAMYYMTLYYSTKDSLFKVNSENRLHELETLFQVREKDKQIQSYKNEVEFQEKTRRLLLFISLALAIIAILLFYFFRLKSKIIKQNKLVYEKERRIQEIILEKKDKENRLLQTEKKKKELEAKLISEKLDLEKDISERKSRELSTSVMHMTNKNEILNKIKDQLEDTNLTQSSKIKDIIYEIKQSIRLDTDWEQFKLHFEAVNPNFFNTLKQKYPDISQNELKLCAYLRMNLSSKEIAQMSNISIAGVNKSRQRLRKKLNIDSDVNLVELMLKY
jgi:DNA-binding CsgD family transcriptional regulator